jgi:hypothetical protein
LKPNVNVSSSDSLAKMRASLQQLAKKKVYVGVPEDHTARQSGEATNAQLVYLHTNGSPLRGIPARPIIEPALAASDNKQLITKQLGEAARAVLAHKPDQTSQHLNQAGILGSNAAKRWFTDSRNGWAPDAPSTIKRKGSDRPLVDTGQMRRSITFLVED